jgi:hypothetical protein
MHIVGCRGSRAAATRRNRCVTLFPDSFLQPAVGLPTGTDTYQDRRILARCACLALGMGATGSAGSGAGRGAVGWRGFDKTVLCTKDAGRVILGGACGGVKANNMDKVRR